MSPPRRSWLRSVHAATALVLMVLFFVTASAVGLALVVGGGALGWGVLEHVRGRGMVMLGLICLASIGAGLVVLWSLVPRIDRFAPPGPELLESAHPALFREITRVAAMTGQRPPSHVYLCGDVNAFVAERGGLMGVGGQRVMGIGLPMLGALTVSELRAVLAHEFGHFVGGDTRLGKWVFKTRLALARTLDNLAEAGNSASDVGEVNVVFALVHAPFRWFFSFYMRFTQGLSRGQEFDADALAVGLEGTAAFVEGMKKVERAAIGYDAYLRHEVAPMMARGFLPPVAAGFSQFMGVEKVSAQVREAAEKSLAQAEAGPFDSHPPTRERLAAAERLAVPSRSRDDRLGLELLGELSALELEVAQSWSEGKALAPIGWDKTNGLLEAGWREQAREVTPHLFGVTLRHVWREPAGLRGLAQRQHGERALSLSDEDVRGWAMHTFTTVLFVMLLDQGFVSVNRPGRAVAFNRGQDVFEPAALVAGWFDGTLEEAAWQAQLEAMGVADRDLSLRG